MLIIGVAAILIGCMVVATGKYMSKKDKRNADAQTILLIGAMLITIGVGTTFVSLISLINDILLI